MVRWCYLFTFIGSFLFLSCEPTEREGEAPPISFQENSEAQAAFKRLTDAGTNLPSAEELNKEINDTTNELHTPPCETCGVAPKDHANGELPSHCQVGNYKNIDQCREHFVQMIIRGGKGQFSTTKLDLGDATYNVMNDAPTLPDGTYVNFTIGEARQMAKAWGCKLPSYNQAAKIRAFAEAQGTRLKARTRSWDNGISGNMQKMMEDDEMKRRAQIGKNKLINGHFKWYINESPNDQAFRFYGFYAPGACQEYCQDHGSTGRHGTSYIDYSQSVRLICP